MSAPPSIAPTFLQLDIAAAFDIAMISVIFAFLFVDLFDTAGTLIAVTEKAGLNGKNGDMPRLGKALLADSSATVAGSLLGTSSTTSYRAIPVTASTARSTAPGRRRRSNKIIRKKPATAM